MKRSIARRTVLVVLATHAILLPALYFGLSIVVTRSHTDVFVQHVRTYSRNLAEELEIGDVLDSRQRVGDFLDLAILSGEGVYAEVVNNGQSIRSGLNVRGLAWPGRQDFDLASSGDRFYFIELPIARAGHAAELRLGFDGRPTSEQIGVAMRNTLWALAAYLVVAIAVSVAFGLQLSRPIVELTKAARRIASGNYVQSLRLDTGVRELHELGADLENMRGELVGVNQRLRAEIGERERAEIRRAELESRLRHRQRVETLGTLAGGIAHEINNALLPIMLLAESAMADTAEDSPVRADLQDILTSARRAKEIVVKVLMFSREAAGVVLEPIELGAVVEEALRLFRVLVPPNVQVKVALSGPYPPVKADAGLTVQLVINLCNNAYQAMHDLAGTLSVALAPEQVPDGGSAVPAGEYVVLTVADTGHGMSPATLERIFEPFFTTREVGSGSGLGLAVVHGIVESFGATILVDSALGRGTTFKVYFPVAGQPPPGEDDSPGDVT